MHFPIACSQSLAEAACVSEATAGAESLMDGVRRGHKFQLLLAASQTSDPAAATLGFTWRLFFFRCFLLSQPLESWEGRNSGGIRYSGVSTWSVFLGQTGGDEMSPHASTYFLKQIYEWWCVNKCVTDITKNQKMTQSWTSHHINRNDVISAERGCSTRLVAMVTVGVQEKMVLVAFSWALTKEKLLLLWLKYPKIKEWREGKKKDTGTNGFLKHRTGQEYCNIWRCF